MKCPACPAVGECVAQRTRHAAFCEWAKSGDAARIARVVELSGSPATPPASSPPPGDAARPDANESLDLAREVRRCPFRSQKPGCGCGGGGSCALRIDPLGPADRPQRGGKVALIECMDCVRKFG